MKPKVYVWKGGSWVRLHGPSARARKGDTAWLDQVPFAALVVQRDLHVTEWNEAAEQLTGRSRGDALGRTCANVLGCPQSPGRCDDACGLCACLRLPSPDPVARGGRRLRSPPSLERAAERRCIHIDDPLRPRGEEGIPVEPLANPLERLGEGGAVLVLRDLRRDLAIERREHERVESLAAQLKRAGAVQRCMLKLPFDRLAWNRLAVNFASFSAPSLEVGGDFFRVVGGGDGVAYAIMGDVLGKGAAAALVAAMASARFEDAVELLDEPGDILRYVNDRLLTSLGGDLFITALVLRIDLKRETYNLARAGHEAPLLLRRRRCLSMSAEPNMPLGFEKGQRFSEMDLPMRPGDRILLYTDGLVENASSAITRRGLRRSLERKQPADARSSAVKAVLRPSAEIGAKQPFT